MTTSTPALWPALMGTEDSARADLRLVSAQGHRVRFADGREALCGTSGLWNVNLGYGNEAVADASAKALREASYLSVFRYTNTYAAEAADVLLDLVGRDRYSRVFFSTSGGAANDAVLKLVRQAQVLRGQSERRLVVALRGSYHGLTYGGFALTGENLGQRLYGVDPRLVRHVTPEDEQEVVDLMGALGAQVAAVVVEPVLGSGTVPLSPGYVQTLLDLRDRHGFLLVADEVATGFGRTGPMFASSAWTAAPDVLITSKGLTNGAATAAAVAVAPSITRAFEESGQVFVHAETQAGTPVSCAAIVAVAQEFERLDALATGVQVSAGLAEGLAELQGRLPVRTSTVGAGAFRTLHLHEGPGLVGPATVAALITAIRQEGAVVHPGPGGVQLVPALTYSPSEVSELLGCVRRGIEALLDRGQLSGATSLEGLAS